MSKEVKSVPMISIVVPVYRSQETLVELCQRITIVIELIDPNFELIFVEDCGGDESWQLIEAFAEKDCRIRGVKLSRNFGQHAATICGFSFTKGKWVVTIDDDLEQDPEYISNLLNKAEEGFDLVYGVYSDRTHERWRNVTSAIARWLFDKAVPNLNHAYTSYRLIRGDVARQLTQFDSPFPFVDGYLSWITNRYTTIKVPHCSRLHGVSNYSFGKLLTHTVNIFVTFSDLPLKLASWLGLSFSLIGMLWIIGIVVGRLSGVITASGFASIMAAVILFGGIQLLILGIFGEYLSRMNFKSSRKPLYLISQLTCHSSDVAE